eukprot:COSAG02_NODE_39887_length_411_cov_1.237179_1_plen_30_part_10
MPSLVMASLAQPRARCVLGALLAVGMGWGP